VKNWTEMIRLVPRSAVAVALAAAASTACTAPAPAQPAAAAYYLALGDSQGVQPDAAGTSVETSRGCLHTPNVALRRGVVHHPRGGTGFILGDERFVPAGADMRAGILDSRSI
jgi:hypothetical protein